MKNKLWPCGFLFLFLAGCGVVGETMQVARDEFGPREMLRKYEWFKDAAAQLDKKKADIRVYEIQLAEVQGEWVGKPKPRDVRQDITQWRRELSGIRTSYNLLARFCRLSDGRRPQGPRGRRATSGPG